MSLHATIAVNRFGLGARPGDIEAVAHDPKGWLLAQLVPETVLPAPLAALPSTLDDLSAFPRWTTELARKGRAQGLDPALLRPAEGMGAAPAGAAQGAPAMARESAGPMSSAGALSVESEFRRTFGPRQAVALKARFEVAVGTDRPFFERLVHFWSNHFVVSGAKPGAIALPPSFERDVIRPHVTGRFVDMLLASTRHPAMLIYLDNWLSIGPNSALGRNPTLRQAAAQRDFAIPQSRGLNENLAREILELQTMGVRSGYSQADVTNFAKVITGWTVARPPRAPYAQLMWQGRLNGRGLFDFDPEAHEPGAHNVLGELFAQSGVAQGEAVLQRLAAHPATASFIAGKLARHFISDNPPAGVVARLADRFRATGGDLAQVCSMLLDSAEAFAQPLQKFKTPEEYLVSAARGLPASGMEAANLQRSLANLGQVVYNPPGPNGWPDLEAEWLGADAVWKRLLWANDTAQRAAAAQLQPAALARQLLGAALSSATLQAIERAESPVQALTLLLASAEFQRR
jgi:uncharacterized protein (DUF1800 family)